MVSSKTQAQALELHAERLRLAEAHEQAKPWYRWGPYLSERQWGTVREDYSPYTNTSTVIRAGASAPAIKQGGPL